MFSHWYAGWPGSIKEQSRAALQSVSGPDTDPEITESFERFFHTQPKPHPLFNHSRFENFSPGEFTRMTPVFALAVHFLISESSLQFINAYIYGERTKTVETGERTVTRFWRPRPVTGRTSFTSATDDVDMSGVPECAPNPLSATQVRRAQAILRELGDFTCFHLCDPGAPTVRESGARTHISSERHSTRHLIGQRSIICINRRLLGRDSRSDCKPEEIYACWIEAAVTIAHEIIHSLGIARRTEWEASVVPELRFETDAFAELGYAWSNFVIGGHIEHHRSKKYLVLRMIPHEEWQLASNTTRQCGERYPYLKPYAIGERLWRVDKWYVYHFIELIKGNTLLNFKSPWVERKAFEEIRYPTPPSSPVIPARPVVAFGGDEEM